MPLFLGHSGTARMCITFAFLHVHWPEVAESRRLSEGVCRKHCNVASVLQHCNDVGGIWELWARVRNRPWGLCFIPRTARSSLALARSILWRRRYRTGVMTWVECYGTLPKKFSRPCTPFQKIARAFLKKRTVRLAEPNQVGWRGGLPCADISGGVPTYYGCAESKKTRASKMQLVDGEKAKRRNEDSWSVSKLHPVRKIFYRVSMPFFLHTCSSGSESIAKERSPSWVFVASTRKVALASMASTCRSKSIGFHKVRWFMKEVSSSLSLARSLAAKEVYQTLIIGVNSVCDICEVLFLKLLDVAE